MDQLSDEAKRLTHLFQSSGISTVFTLFAQDVNEITASRQLMPKFVEEMLSLNATTNVDANLDR